jgi:hypothetical protein
MDSLIERATRLEAEGVFLGGPPRFFEIAGRKQLITLLNEGLFPSSKVLDIGCGCLRGGYWLIHFLDAGCYFGIEPNNDMLEAGINTILEPGLMELKNPIFDKNAEFDFSVFGENFDYFVARSIWTHASKQQIQIMLDGFVNNTTNNGIFLTSYKRPNIFNKDYIGNEWVGKSHESETPGSIRHSFKWIQKECKKRGLCAEEIKEKEYNFGKQTWIRIRR